MSRGPRSPERERGRGAGGWSAGLVLAVGITLSLALGPAAEPAEVGRVTYQDRQLSVVFEATPAEVAFGAIRARTRIEVVLPAAVEGKTLTARMERLPLEVALRHLLRALGLESFVLVYGEGGAVRQVIVLEPGTGRPPPDVTGPPHLPLGSGSPAQGTPVYVPP